MILNTATLFEAIWQAACSKADVYTSERQSGQGRLVRLVAVGTAHTPECLAVKGLEFTMPRGLLEPPCSLVHFRLVQQVLTWQVGNRNSTIFLFKQMMDWCGRLGEGDAKEQSHGRGPYMIVWVPFCLHLTLPWLNQQDSDPRFIFHSKSWGAYGSKKMLPSNGGKKGIPFIEAFIKASLWLYISPLFKIM